MSTVGGIVSLLKQDIPQRIKFHCVAHNLQLAFINMLKSNKTMKTIKERLNGCWKHYKYSALRELQEFGEAMEVAVGEPTKPNITCWVSHLHRTITVLLKKFGRMGKIPDRETKELQVFASFTSYI